MTFPQIFSYTESHRSGQGAGQMCLKKSQLFNFDIFRELCRKKKKFIHVVFSPNLLLLSLSSFLFAGVRERTLKTYIFPSIYVPCCPHRCWNTMSSFPLPMCPTESVCFILTQTFCHAKVCISLSLLFSGCALCSSVRYAHPGHLHGSKYFEEESFGLHVLVILVVVFL